MLFTTSEPPKLPPIIQIVIEQKIEQPTSTPTSTQPQVEAKKTKTWKDNPNNCTDSQWIAQESPFYCIDKNTPPKAKNPSKTIKRGSPGNTYTPGNCTYGVKQWVPWIPNGLGNANTWDNRAPSYGLGVHHTPIVGAVAQTDRGYYGHVGVVTAVGNGTVTIKDMNYSGLWSVNTHVIPTTSYVYIY